LNLEEFNSLVGQDSYVRCQGKERTDPAIVNKGLADNHLFSGGTVGWWVRTGYIVVDIDEGKEEALQAIKELGIKTLMCKTTKGIHMYFKTDKDYPQKIGMVLPCGLKCDFRCANKGYVLLPFGVKGRGFNKIPEIMDMPIEFTPLANRKESLLGLKEGDGRNATLFAHLMAYKHKGATDTQITDMANTINKIIFKEPMPALELEKIVENTKKYAAELQGDNPYLIYNAKGVPSQVNARSICDYFVNKGDVFVLGGECYQYNQGVYKEASGYVRNAIREMIGIDSLITQSRIVEVYRLILDDTRIQRSDKELNKERNLVNFSNGNWDIEHHKLIPHSAKNLLTVQIPHEMKKANKPWKDTKLYKFLNDQCHLPQADIDMISQYMAYCLTLQFGLKTFMILQGRSNTGKSILIRFIESMVGLTNTSALSMHELNQRFYPAQLYGTLLNSCADNSSLPLSSIENLKKITGGDQIMHEKKGKEPFFFVPFSKLLFSFNQLPLQLEEKSNAFYMRMRILCMDIELFLNDKYVNDLCSDTSIMEVIPHLLSLMPLKEVKRSAMSDTKIEGMRSESDSIHAFLKECCMKGKAKNGGPRSVLRADLYTAYINFCIDLGREAYKKHSFMSHMREQKGVVEIRQASGGYIYQGIRLKKGVK